jgi:hypothetical protein
LKGRRQPLALAERPAGPLGWARSDGAVFGSVLAVGLLLAGCAGQKTATSTHVGADVVNRGTVTQRAASGTGGSAVNDDNPASADTGRTHAAEQGPCKLVTQAQAQAIVGGTVDTPQEAPMGPTCIYQPHGSRSSITLAVESIDFASIRSHMRHRRRVDVAGRRAYCGVYGQEMTFVPLSGGRVLNVTAPCALGVRFAAAALPHV